MERKIKNRKKILWLILLAILWEIIGYFEWVHPLVFPKFSTVLIRLVLGIKDGTLLIQGLHSLTIVLIGLSIGCLIGLLMACLDYFSSPLQALFELLATMLHPLPGVVILPIVLLFAGVGVEGICLVIIHNVVWSFYLSTKNGFKNIPKEYIEVASNNGASQWQLLRYVLLPLSTEHIKTGVHIGWSRGWRGLISSEMIFGAISQIGGLGWYMYERRSFMDTPGMYAGIIFVMLIGLLIEGYLLPKFNM
ncbi:ABC transporter permease subunit [Vallitaleaceae bacterium 9-2]